MASASKMQWARRHEFSHQDPQPEIEGVSRGRQGSLVGRATRTPTCCTCIAGLCKEVESCLKGAKAEGSEGCEGKTLIVRLVKEGPAEHVSQQLDVSAYKPQSH